MITEQQGREISHLIRLLFVPSKISTYTENLPKYFHPFTHCGSASSATIRIHWNPDQKLQKINCWRNWSPITTVIRQSVGKTPPAKTSTLVCTQTTVSVQLTFRFSSGSSCFVQQLWYVSVMQMSCINRMCAVASTLLLSKPVEKSV